MVLRNAMFAGAVAVTAAVVGAAGAWKWLMPPAHHGPAPAPATANAREDDEPPEGDDWPTVKTVHPKRDKTYTLTVHQYATVQAYYQAELRARASGVIKYIPKDKGARVTQGELLVEIDVPDLRQEVAQKDAVVEQKRNELRLAKSQIKTVTASIELAQAAIEQAQSQVTAAQATRDY